MRLLLLLLAAVSQKFTYRLLVAVFQKVGECVLNRGVSYLFTPSLNLSVLRSCFEADF
jgi:predicted GH43/DUF377 family glycosyl hydrolase